MYKFTLGLAASLALAAPSSAQQQASVRPIQGKVRNAGIYHVSTGTWTRHAAQSAALGPDVIYANDADSTYFTSLNSAQATGDYSIIDAGRIPTTASPIANVDRVEYLVNALQFTYCSDVVGPNLGITFNLYESYEPCDLLSAPALPVVLAGSLSAAGLPAGSVSGSACWILTLDLSGSGEFCLEGDGGAANPGLSTNPGEDAFGIEWIFHGAAGTVTGPRLAGDPSWTINTAGSHSGVGGGGTYYDQSFSTCAGSTGLDTQDFFAVDGANAPLAPGCYFFGGYKNTNGCGQAHATPFSSFSTTIYASTDECISDCPTFCPPNVSSTGQPVTLRCTQSTNSPSGWRLDASGGPAGEFAYLQVSADNSNATAIGNGILCLGGTGAVGSYNANSGTDNSIGAFDALGNYVRSACGSCNTPGFDVPTSLPAPLGGPVTSGSTWHFQLWYRDQTAAGNTVNFSNGVTVNF